MLGKTTQTCRGGAGPINTKRALGVVGSHQCSILIGPGNRPEMLAEVGGAAFVLNVQWGAGVRGGAIEGDADVVSAVGELQRFVDAQARVIDRVRGELKSGRKTSHWMWFVFPQVSGLGHSDAARRYAIHSLDEARAYLAHPVLGPRLRECTRLVLAAHAPSIADIFEYPDNLKFHSSMTLFARAAAEPVFREALVKYFSGEEDPQTVKRL